MKLRLPGGSLDLTSTAVMGILNTTPDSFYDGGSYTSREQAIARAHAIQAEGAALIDIGGEKAGPGPEVSAEEELRRVVPIIETVARTTSLPISIDTRRPQVARAALDAGASIVNSITGFDDPELRRVARDGQAAVVLMHIQGQPRVANPNPTYSNVTADVRAFLLERAETCRCEGIHPDRIVIDPGPGFGKTTAHDLRLMHDLQSLTTLPYPVLVAVSRKKFIGDVLHLDPAGRLAGSLAVAAWAVQHGARIIRAHDVQATVRTCRMIEAVLDPSWQPTP